ncbi:hypothetical protein [Bailinhaonella thermotolerans]|uniref:Uncharacterized protein n=1 Tax=Bailinhaonella thermotolerans TaxID=1070861 RepID=A0A3A4BAM9_9ACTN|nr:hypothetical protein [Bailinhaonella thermotolerans]RJL35643.1 hypothetical protein D5H75_02315 [Bailinhaonella thermotolerans]
MKIRSVSAALLIATALAAPLAGAAAASASTQYGAAPAAAERHALSPLPPDWYWSARYDTMAACDAAFEDAAQNGGYTGLAPCRWYAGDRHRLPGYYFLIYIP